MFGEKAATHFHLWGLLAGDGLDLIKHTCKTIISFVDRLARVISAFLFRPHHSIPTVRYWFVIIFLVILRDACNEQPLRP